MPGALASVGGAAWRIPCDSRRGALGGGVGSVAAAVAGAAAAAAADVASAVTSPARAGSTAASAAIARTARTSFETCVIVDDSTPDTDADVELYP